jgi:uncharacterized membrane protein
MVKDFGVAEISFLIISKELRFVKKNLRFFLIFFGNDRFEVICLEIWKKSVLFYLGGCTYVAMELCWRGRSHGSMFVAGGLCFLLMGHLGKIQPKLPLLPRALTGAGIITMVELATGLLVNRSYSVWDYRSVPGNYLGQICPVYTCLWIPVALMAMVIYDALDRRISGAVCR